MTSVEARAQLLLDPLRAIPDPHERLTAITGRSTPVQILPAEERTETRRVSGCVSRVWLAGAVQGGRLHLQVAAESVMVRSLVELLCEVYDQLPACEIQGTELDFAGRLDLRGLLSPTRLHGLEALQQRILLWTENAC